MYKHIIWDFDGTLFDSYPTLALAAKNAGIDGCYYQSYSLHDCDIADYTITDYSHLEELLDL